ncbi:uncharacterized protein LOC131928607 [Physella acuta]|uniref:uncharacterized protein LOC131928607 n=1 Tax=Physella acuta TaxID=109671 RepID=UPI0027DC901A|nr:uncharacterized protein LOC131928607 [Physella acuta]
MEPPPKGSLGSVCFFQRYKIRVPTMALSNSRTEHSFVAEASPQNYQNQSPYPRSPSPGPLCSQGEDNLSSRSYRKPPFIPAAYHKSTVASRNKLNPCAVRLKSQSPKGYGFHKGEMEVWGMGGGAVG